jgi:hypothetical protein
MIKKILCLGIVNMFLLTGFITASADKLTIDTTFRINDANNQDNFPSIKKFGEISKNKPTKITFIDILSRIMKGVPPALEPGDLILCETWNILKKLGYHDVAPGDPYGFDHVALYVGKGKINKKGQFIPSRFGIEYALDAFGPVGYTPLLRLNLRYKLFYAKVTNATEITKQKALSFARSRIGDLYQHFFSTDFDDYEKLFRWHANSDPFDENDPLSQMWYCAELVWASYYNAGIDLDDSFPEDHDKDGCIDLIEDYGLIRYVSPKNIYLSVNTTRFDDCS